MIGSLVTSWNSFWFTPAPAQQLAAARMGIGTVAALWFASFLPSSSAWFGEGGILSLEMSRQLIAFEMLSTWQAWSPLWWTDSPALHQGWLIAGMIWAVLAGVGWGGRAVTIGLWLWIIAWTHRILWLSGPVEPAMIAMVGYLVVEPGRPLWAGSRAEPPGRWTANVALRLIQTHWWILVAGGVASQLANLAWWRGEAVWWLAASGRSHLVSVDLLSGKPWLVNLLTHATVAIELLALWLICVPAARALGLIAAVISCLAIGLVADQLLYGLLLAACLLAFRQPPSPNS